MTVFGALLPSFLLTAGLLAVLLADVLGKGRNPHVLAWISGTALAAAAAAAFVPLARGLASDRILLGALRMDGFALTLTAFCLPSAASRSLAKTFLSSSFRTKS